MKHIFPIYFLAAFFCCNACLAQTFYPLGFQRNQNIPVIQEHDTLHLAWAGGMNGLSFYSFDLNADGTQDLIAFEKNGNRLLPFIQENNRWTYHPEYRHFFPELHDWVIKSHINKGSCTTIKSYIRIIWQMYLSFYIDITKWLLIYISNSIWKI